MPFYKSTSSNTRISNEKVNTGQIAVSTVKETGVTTVKASACYVWRPKMTDLNNVSKDNSGSWVSKRGNPQQALKNKGIFDSGCSRHMTRNKDFLIDYQDIDGGFVAFGGSSRGVAERKNKTLVEAAKTMLADSLLSTIFWAEAVNIACYVLNRVLVTKPHNKTSYELIIGRPPSISFIRPFGCPVTILNTLDPLGKFDGKAKEGFLVGYPVNSKALRVFNSQTRKVEENLHVNFLKNKPNVARQGPNWLFDIDSLTNSMNYQPVTAGNQTNKNKGPQEANGDTGLKKRVNARQSEEKNVSTQYNIMFSLWSYISSSYKSSDETYKNDTADDAAGETPVQKTASENEQILKNVLEKMMDQEEGATKASSTNSFNTISTPVNAASAPRNSNDAGLSFVSLGGSFPLNVNDLLEDLLMPNLENTAEVQNTGIFGSAYDDDDLDTYNSPFADQVMGVKADFNNMEPSTIAIGTKWVYRNKKDERGIVVRNKGRLVAQGYKQEEGINYDEVFAPVARIEAIRLFLAYASFMNFLMYQMDVKSAFLYGTIEEEMHDLKGDMDPHEFSHVYLVISSVLVMNKDMLLHSLLGERAELTTLEAHIEQLLPSPTTYQRKRKTQTRRKTTKDTKLPQTSVPQDLEADEAVHKEGTRSGRVLKQPIEPPLSEGHTSGSGEGRMEHQFELTANVPITPHDSPLPGGYTPGSDEGRLKLQELMTMCTKLSKQVLDLEKEKDAQAVEILRLKKRVKRLERQRKSSTSQPRRRKYRHVESSDDDLNEEDASKQGRSSDKTEPMLCNC
ncbi:putative ribonuclease H-like domain-containing protein [Tanacetum coccineum]